MPNEPTWDDILRPKPSDDASGQQVGASSVFPPEPTPAVPAEAEATTPAPRPNIRAAATPAAPEQLPPPKTRRELREREAAALAASGVAANDSDTRVDEPHPAPLTPAPVAARPAAVPASSPAPIPPSEPRPAEAPTTRTSVPTAPATVPAATVPATTPAPAAPVRSDVATTPSDDADVLAEMFAPAAASDGSGGGRSKRGNGLPPRERRRGRFAWLWVLLFLFVIVGAGAGYVWLNFEDQVRSVMGWELPNDYEGDGNGKAVSVTITAGQIGEDVARTLEKQGVTRTFDAFYDLLLARTEPANFQPGTYKLEEHMSAASALAELLKPDNRVVSKVTIPEGSTLKQTLARLAKGTGVSSKEFSAAAKKYTQFGVPKAAPSLEGFLFPATYQFDPGLTATQILQRMVDRMNQSLDDAGVKKSQRLDVLTMAALIQKEGGSTKDFYKVSRVFHNRLDQNMLLQSDATVSYGSGGTSISTTDAERADADNPYNTYVHLGLPVGPISAPGDDAIKAALKPAKGNWLYFVLVNGDTGETTFSNTLAEHDAAVLVWQAWLRAHPDFDN